jgi:hypothetical protein
MSSGDHEPIWKRLDRALAARPWIWIVLGYLFVTAVLIGVVMIAVKNAPAEIPLKHGR